MSELQFLIELLLNQKLSSGTKKLVAERIAQVEQAMRVPRGTNPSVIKPDHSNGPVQAASTQAILNRDPSLDVPNSTPIVMAPLPAIAPATNRIIGGEVNTGKGTRGPRKF